jgi:hypothetical protein
MRAFYVCLAKKARKSVTKLVRLLRFAEKLFPFLILKIVTFTFIDYPPPPLKVQDDATVQFSKFTKWSPNYEYPHLNSLGYRVCNELTDSAEEGTVSFSGSAATKKN